MKSVVLTKVTVLTMLISSALSAQWLTGYYRGNNVSMPVSKIPWNKYTHIIHFAAAPALDAAGNFTGRLGMYYLNQGEINQLVASRPPGKKVLVSVKANDANLGALQQCLDPAYIDTFVNDIVNLVNNNGYDGVDLDWEHAVDANKYILLIAKLRAALPNKLITMASGDWEGLDVVAGTSQSLLDQINVMCYDMDWPGAGDCEGSECSWYNSALHQSGYVWRRACDLREGRVAARGVPNYKLGIGLPFYVRRHLGVTQPAVIGNFLYATMNYADIVTDPTRWQSAYLKYDSVFSAEYLSIPTYDEFISLNSTRSMGDYASWIRSNGFGGAMTFTMEQEFVRSASGDAQYPLSTALNSGLFGSGIAAGPSATVSPANSAGSSSLFNFQITGSTGSAALILQVGLTIDTALDLPNSCVLDYWAPNRLLFLKGDDNLSWTSASLGSATTLSNGQCLVNVAASSFSGDTLTLSMTFNQATFRGRKSLFTFVADSAGNASNWVNIGTFLVQ